MAGGRKEDPGKKDIGRVMIVALSAGGWLFLVLGTCLFGLAKPEPNTFYDRLYYTSPRRDWNLDLIRYAGPVLLAGIACALGGVLAYLGGVQSRKYRFPVSLALTGILSLALYVYLRYAFDL